jgi:hypothetical protein
LPKRVLLFAALAAAVLGGCERKPEPQIDAWQAPSLVGRVRVLDADVLIVDGVHVRMSGFVTPQPIPQARCWAEASAAKQAADAVAAMVRDASRIETTPTGEKDEYTRTVASVRLDGLDIGQALYDRGLAAKGDVFNWCAPLRQAGDGAPTLSSVTSFER